MRRNTPWHVALVVLLGPGLARHAAAQSGIVGGTVTDSATQRPVVGAQVSIGSGARAPT